ncbi:flagellar export protein FliJ [Chitinilyticum piscinae]|uniref:Flagellar FliJ protein n=1 Tax=Chitinilyticum piscinae TaxID=2866724 RepID=A0A8J7K1K6_9NEIS|nr:flagellar export protein FliJ [Chitinilyticum piscinae]MBE9608812.1 flagellar export protein FliJ [Chitinilyticum piscinae]
MAQFRFAFLLQLARDEREDAARKMQEAQASWLTAQGKFQQLDGYRAEYRARLTAQNQGGMTVAQWRDYQLFLGKLDEACSLQQQEIQRLELRYQQLRAVWQEKDRKVSAFEALQQRHDKAELLREGKQEQKLLDEFNSRLKRN